MASASAGVYYDRVPYPVFIGIIWMGIGICVLFFAVRIWIRIVCFRTMFPEDYMTLLALILLLGFAIMAQYHMADIYWLNHTLRAFKQKTVPPDWPPDLDAVFVRTGNALKTEGVSLVLFITGIFTIKLSLLGFFCRLGYRLPRYLILCWIAGALVLGCSFTGIGLIPYHCLFAPPKEAMVTCTSTSYGTYLDQVNKASVAIDVVSDIVVICFPVALLWKARISVRQKVTLSAVFCLVGCTIAVTVVRGLTFNDIDVSWAMFFFFIEYTVAFLIACIISFRALWGSHVRTQMERDARRRPSPTRAQARALALAQAQAQAQHGRGLRGQLRNWFDTVVDTFHDLEGATLGRSDAEMLRLPMPASGLMTVDFSRGDTGWGDKRRTSEEAESGGAARRSVSPARSAAKSAAMARVSREAGKRKKEEDLERQATETLSLPLPSYSHGYAVDRTIQQGDYVGGGIYAPAYGAREPALVPGVPESSAEAEQTRLDAERPESFEGEMMVIPRRWSFVRRGRQSWNRGRGGA